MSRLVQYVDKGGQRRVAVASEDSSRLHPLSEVDRTYDLALEGIRRGRSLESLIKSRVQDDSIDYEPIIREQRLLPPLDHRDPARCLVSLTGLTHIGSAKSRDEMHAAAAIPATDSIRMFDIGLAGGKPVSGKIGAQPEWAYKGDGRCVVPPEQPLTQPAFAEDGGEEAEMAGLYVIDDSGTPWRVGYSIGNEFSDHILERTNYLYLAHSKLRQCSFGPELYVGELPDRVTGTVRVLRGEEIVWSGAFESGEANMCHSIANLEHHYFKYELFRRPGDVHVYFFGANSVSFGANIRTYDGDLFVIDVPIFGWPLRNPLKVDRNDQLVRVRRL
jgi:hypothetical protein